MKLLLILCFTLLCLHAAVCEYKRVCYYTNWSQYRSGKGKFWPENIDPFLCTHIVYAFGKLMNNKITNYEWNDVDTENEGLYSRINALKEANPNLKTLLAMGGWNAGSKDFSIMAATAANRKTFIDSAIKFLRDNRFDGLDIDWEYPTKRGGAAADYTTFGLLTKELRQAFEQEAIQANKNRLLLTAAVAGGKGNIDGAYDAPLMAMYMDFICIMTYDFHGAWDTRTGHNSPLGASAADTNKYFNMKWAAEYWNSLGIPKSKLIIGLATYGRAFTLADPSNYGVSAPTKNPAPSGPYTREAGFFSYYEICMKQQKGQGTTFRDTEAGVPYYVDGDTWVSFDDEVSIYNKTKNFIVPGGYGGAMIWSLPLDDFLSECGAGRFPLINIIKDVLVAAETGSTVQPPTNTFAPTPAPTTSSGTNAQGSTARPNTLPPSNTTPNGDTIILTCSGMPRGYMFPDVDNCQNFFHCSTSGTAFKKSCPDGLLFDHLLSRCEWPRNVDCTRGLTTIHGQSSTTGTTTTTTPQTTTTTPQTTTTTSTTTQTTTIRTTQSPSTSNFCAGKPNGLHADPTDCAAYFNCWQGVGVQQRCAPNLLWNQSFKGCDFYWRVTCETSGFTPVVTKAPTTAAPTTPPPVTPAPTAAPTFGPVEDCTNMPNGFYKHPRNCNMFIQCHSGIRYDGNCPAGLHFNAAYNACDWPANAGCKPNK